MIYGISGKKNSGKDTVCKIIQYIKFRQQHDESIMTSCTQFLTLNTDTRNKMSGWQHKSFAYKLKQMICILLGCSMDNLEDRTFKEKELEEQWWYFKRNIMCDLYSNTVHCLKWPYAEFKDELTGNSEYKLVKLTPRLLMQILATEGVVNILHPNSWVNALMNEYQPIGYIDKSGVTSFQAEFVQGKNPVYPGWVISDLRYKGMPGIFNDPYELEAIKLHGGKIIRVERPGCDSGDQHRSEIALDEYNGFDHVIMNDGTLDDLMIKIKDIL